MEGPVSQVADAVEQAREGLSGEQHHLKHLPNKYFTVRDWGNESSEQWVGTCRTWKRGKQEHLFSWGGEAGEQQDV